MPLFFYASTNYLKVTWLTPPNPFLGTIRMIGMLKKSRRSIEEGSITTPKTLKFAIGKILLNNLNIFLSLVGYSSQVQPFYQEVF